MEKEHLWCSSIVVWRLYVDLFYHRVFSHLYAIKTSYYRKCTGACSTNQHGFFFIKITATNSHNLPPIEHVWAIPDRRVWRYPQPPATLQTRFALNMHQSIKDILIFRQCHRKFQIPYNRSWRGFTQNPFLKTIKSRWQFGDSGWVVWKCFERSVLFGKYDWHLIPTLYSNKE